jgi:hypothetical protein
MADIDDATLDEHGTVYFFFQISGPRLRGSYVIGNRSLATGYRWSSQEAWLFRVEPPALVPLLGIREQLTGVWSASPDSAWASSSSGIVYQLTAGGIVQHRPLSLVSGIVGVSDSEVYAWDETNAALARFDGRAWSAMDSPGKVITLCLGPADELYAGCYDGLVFRRSRGRWVQVDLFHIGNVVSMARRGESAYACTTNGELIELSENGAQVVGRWSRALNDLCITASGRCILVDGLEIVLEWNGRDFVPIDPALPLWAWAAGTEGRVAIAGELLVEMTPELEGVVESVELERFREQRGSETPMWE